MPKGLLGKWEEWPHAAVSTAEVMHSAEAAAACRDPAADLVRERMGEEETAGLQRDWLLILLCAEREKARQAT